MDSLAVHGGHVATGNAFSATGIGDGRKENTTGNGKGNTKNANGAKDFDDMMRISGTRFFHSKGQNGRIWYMFQKNKSPKASGCLGELFCIRCGFPQSPLQTVPLLFQQSCMIPASAVVDSQRDVAVAPSHASSLLPTFPFL